MSYAHADCARQILRLLASPGDKMTRTELNKAVSYLGKNETNFGSTIADLVQGGILEENRIPLRPTQYIRTAKPVPGAGPLKSAPAAKPTPTTRSIEWPARRAGAKKMPRSYPATRARRAEILRRMNASGNTHFTVDDVRDFGIHASVVSNIYTDLAALCAGGALIKIDGGRPLTWKLPTALPRAAETPAVQPTRMPLDTAAPVGAAVNLDWQAVKVALEDALQRALDARDAYVRSKTDRLVLDSFDASIESTKTALHIHRQSRAA